MEHIYVVVATYLFQLQIPAPAFPPKDLLSIRQVGQGQGVKVPHMTSNPELQLPSGAFPDNK
jgi:hypothetical protein